jgi:hypothetical protein
MVICMIHHTVSEDAEMARRRSVTASDSVGRLVSEVTGEWMDEGSGHEDDP